MIMFLFSLGNWLSDVADNLMGSLEVAIRTLSFSFNRVLHILILNLYDFFELLCNPFISNGLQHQNFTFFNAVSYTIKNNISII